MEYHETFGHKIGRIQHIAIMSRIDLCYGTCRLTNQTVAPTLPGFQGIKRYVQYLANHQHKPIFYPYYSYYGSNIISLIWSGNQVKDQTTQNCLEYHKYTDHVRVLNRRLSFSGIMHTMFGVSVCWKVHIYPDIVSDSIYGEIICMQKSVKKNKVIWRYLETLALHNGAPTVHW